MASTDADPAALPTTAPLPSPSDVEFYRTHGYWISPPVLPDEVLDTAERGMARLYAGETDHALTDGRRSVGWTPDDGDVLRKNDYSSLLIDELATLVRHPIIAAMAACLAGTSEIRLWHDQLLYKPSETGRLADGHEPGRVNVGWHTDRQYWRTCSSADMLTAWVPFHDVGEREGAVSFVVGSHLWPEDVVLDFFDPDLSTLERVKERHEVEVMVATIPRGAMSFHHCRTIHGSGPNLASAPRRSMAIHLQPGDNEFVRHTFANGELASHPNDGFVRRLPDGRPDYADPAVCPRLWPSPRDEE
ncbi:MAG TPA: phytanoyl-CoA dioxygenase family protein [Actinopolymorphaceae bacterium]